MPVKHEYDVDQPVQNANAIKETLTKRAEEGWRLFSVTAATGSNQLFLIWERDLKEPWGGAA